MIEAKLFQPLQAIARQRHAGGDEVGVEPRLRRDLDDVLEIFANRRLAARQMDLQDSEFGGLPHHVLPFGRSSAPC